MSNFDQNLVQELEREIEQVRYALNAEIQRGSLADGDKVAELKAKLDDVSQRLDVEIRLAETKEHEKRVEESQGEIAYILDTLRAGDNTMRDLTVNEGAYQLLREVIQLAMMQRDEHRLNELQKKDKEISMLTADVESLQQQSGLQQQQYDELYENYTLVRTELNNERIGREEAELKRDAAATQLDEAKREIERLNSHIDDLRAEIAVGAPAATKIVQTNVNTNMAELVQQFNASKPAIYDVEALDNKQSRYRAKLASTGEEIEFGYLEKGKYREVTAEEAEVFRTEAKHAEEDTALDAGQETGVTFQEESTIDSVVEGDANGEVATKTVEERLQALEVAVFGQVQGAA